MQQVGRGYIERTFQDPYNRETPRSMTTAYIGAVASDDFKRAAQYLTLDEEMEPTRPQRLQKTLDDGGSLLPFAALSNDDGLNPEQTKLERSSSQTVNYR